MINLDQVRVSPVSHSECVSLVSVATSPPQGWRSIEGAGGVVEGARSGTGRLECAKSGYFAMIDAQTWWMRVLWVGLVQHDWTTVGEVCYHLSHPSIQVIAIICHI